MALVDKILRLLFLTVFVVIFSPKLVYADSVYAEKDKLEELELRIENLESRLRDSKEDLIIINGAKVYQAISTCEELVPTRVKELKATGETYRSPFSFWLIQRQKYDYVDSDVQAVINQSQTVRILRKFDCVDEQKSFYLISLDSGTDVWAVQKSDTIAIE